MSLALTNAPVDMVREVINWLSAREPRYWYANRAGVCAFARIRRSIDAGFRRERRDIVFEVVTSGYKAKQSVVTYALGEHFQREAARLLNR